MVDSNPTELLPPSKIKGILLLSSSCTSLADVGLIFLYLFALGAASGNSKCINSFKVLFKEL